jgi:hypothetical protein
LKKKKNHKLYWTFGLVSVVILLLICFFAWVWITGDVDDGAGVGYGAPGKASVATSVKTSVVKAFGGGSKTATAKLSVPSSPLEGGATISSQVISLIGNTANVRVTYSVPQSFRSGSAMDMSQYLIDVEVVGIDALMQDWQTFMDSSMSFGTVHPGTYLGDAMINNGNTYMSGYENADGSTTYYFKDADGDTWQTNDRIDVDGDGVTNSDDRNNTDGPAAGRGGARDDNGDGDTTDPNDDHDGDGVDNSKDDYPNDPERSEDSGDDEEEEDDDADDSEDDEDIWYDSEGGMYIMNILYEIMQEVSSQTNTESLIMMETKTSLKNTMMSALSDSLTSNIVSGGEYCTVAGYDGGIAVGDGGTWGGPIIGTGGSTGSDADCVIQSIRITSIRVG